MITPKFKLTQSESELFIKIHAPFARLADTEVNIEENIFIFYSFPYYLRLNLPGKLVDSEKEVHKATFDADEGNYLITCMKQTFGEEFSDLDMLTDLLTPKGSDKLNIPVIEVLSGVSEENGGGDDDDADDDHLDWFYEQTFPEDCTSEGYKYGFANSYCNVFSTLSSELSNIVDVTEPDSKPLSERIKERLQTEGKAFNEDHYLADLYDNEEMVPNLKFEPLFYKLRKDDVEFSSLEEETLLKLPRKELLLDKGCKIHLYLAIIDILFAWCYDHRITLGENCVESAWNIRKLSSTLSWLDMHKNLKDVAICSVRRSLIYPLMRNWDLSLLVLQDVTQILSLGRKQVLKCLLEIHSHFNSYEPYYILNQLYINDFCVWIQTVKEEKLISLGDALKKVSLKKEDMELEIVELEAAAEMVIKEEEEAENMKAEENINNIADSVSKISVIENVFAVSRNDNDTEVNSDPIFSATDATQESESDSTDDSSDDSDDSGDDSDTSDSDDDSDSSSGSDSLDSDDDEQSVELILQNNNQ